MGGAASSAQEIGGVRVFKVSPGSPAAEAGLEVFFDFIVEVNGTQLDPSCQQAFSQKIQESENGQAKLLVFNTRAHTNREVTVAPRRWAGTGLLGATVRYDIVDPAENHGIRVLEVFPNSPAAHAGLVPFQDYLLGTAQAVFHDLDELVEAVTNSINERLEVYVYNADSETVREVIMVPNSNWGGDGCIGCDIGTGLLHRIPAPRRPPGSSPAAGHAAPYRPAAPPPVPAQAPGAPAYGMPAGMPAPAYPPGVAAPPPQVPTAVPSSAIPTPVVAGSITGVPLTGIPPVPGAPPGPAAPPPAGPSVPAYVPGVVVPGGAAPASGAPVVTGIAPPGTMPMPTPGLAEQPAPTLPTGGRQVGGVMWPPPPGYRPPDYDEPPQQDVVGAGVAMSPGSGTANSLSTAEFPKAPPGTPLNLDEVPPPTDLSAAMNPSRFGPLPGGSPSNGPGLGAELYQPAAPQSGAASQVAALL